jgi:hypothetical protein
MTTLLTEDKMIEFPSQDGVEIYASDAGFICFKALGDLQYTEEQIVCLTIGQFRAVIKNAPDLIEQAELNKAEVRND